MDHPICINQNSFPADTKESASQLFYDSLQGVLELFEDEDRGLFYLDSNGSKLFEFEIAKGFTFQDFLDDCIDQDLAAFLYEIEEKSPALDTLTEEQIEEMASYTLYVKDKAIDDFIDIYALTWMLSGYLLSINTDDAWSQSLIQMECVDENGRPTGEEITLRNISTQDHGVAHFDDLHSVNLEELVSPHIASEQFLTWFHLQTSENQSRVIDKLRLAHQRDFQGGEPLFKTLTDSHGLREIRFSAYPGGAIRVLFKSLEGKQVILTGFIKKSNSEGYSEAKEQALEVYSNF